MKAHSSDVPRLKGVSQHQQLGLGIRSSAYRVAGQPRVANFARVRYGLLRIGMGQPARLIVQDSKIVLNQLRSANARPELRGVQPWPPPARREPAWHQFHQESPRPGAECSASTSTVYAVGCSVSHVMTSAAWPSGGNTG